MTTLKTLGTLLALVWGALWYLPAWLAGVAFTALRRGWRDGSSPSED